MYLIKGDENYFIEQKTREIVQNFALQNNHEIRVINYSIDIDIEKFVSEIFDVDIFSPKKIIVLQNIDFLNAKSKIKPTLLDEIIHILETKNQEFNYAKAKVDNINQTLLFKLFSSRFTPQDKEVLRRITGSDKIDIDALNHVADFMFVTDSAGNILGLSEMFITMLNGLGYFNGKDKKHGSWLWKSFWWRNEKIWYSWGYSCSYWKNFKRSYC